MEQSTSALKLINNVGWRLLMQLLKLAKKLPCIKIAYIPKVSIDQGWGAKRTTYYTFQ
jgi:hypothetical protein